MRHVTIYQKFHLRYRPIYRPRGDISTHIGPKRYPVKFFTYRIVLDKIPVSRPMYRYIGWYLKQFIHFPSHEIFYSTLNNILTCQSWKHFLQQFYYLVTCLSQAITNIVSDSHLNPIHSLCSVAWGFKLVFNELRVTTAAKENKLQSCDIGSYLLHFPGKLTT